MPGIRGYRKMDDREQRLNRLYAIGKETHEYSWDDKELQEQIDILQETIAYLTGRGDCTIVVMALNLDLRMFVSLQQDRESLSGKDRS